MGDFEEEFTLGGAFTVILLQPRGVGWDRAQRAAVAISMFKQKKGDKRAVFIKLVTCYCLKYHCVL